MRSLNKNKTKLYVVNITGYTDKKDSNNNYTGEKIPTFSTVTQINICLNASNGIITERIFGKDASFDKIAISTENLLNKNSLLFKSSPSANYDTTYDYKVSEIKESINEYYYGLKGRI